MKIEIEETWIGRERESLYIRTSARSDASLAAQTNTNHHLQCTPAPAAAAAAAVPAADLSLVATTDDHSTD